GGAGVRYESLTVAMARSIVMPRLGDDEDQSFWSRPGGVFSPTNDEGRHRTFSPAHRGHLPHALGCRLLGKRGIRTRSPHRVRRQLSRPYPKRAANLLGELERWKWNNDRARQPEWLRSRRELHHHSDGPLRHRYRPVSHLLGERQERTDRA